MAKQYFVFFKDLVTQVKDGIMRKEDKIKLDNIEKQANKTVVDTALSKTSQNPVENKVIATEIENLKKSGSDGKKNVAAAITGMGVPTATDADFDTITENIEKIGGDTTVSSSDILSGKVAYAKGTYITGSMPNHGAKTAALDCGESYTIPAGYHNGAGRVSANSLASQTLATAGAGDILSGKTAYVNGSKVTGSIQSKPAATYTPGTTDQEIAAKQYLSGKQTVKGDTNLAAGNIKKGVSIFGVAGSFTEDATAAAADILSGKTAYVNGVKVSGNIPSKAAVTYTPTTRDQEIAAGQYLSGKQTVKGDSNLIAANIKKGVSIFGVSGSLEGGGVLNSIMHNVVFEDRVSNYEDGNWYGCYQFSWGRPTGVLYTPNLPTDADPIPLYIWFDSGAVVRFSNIHIAEWIYGSCPSYVKILSGSENPYSVCLDNAPSMEASIMVHGKNIQAKYARIREACTAKI